MRCPLHLQWSVWLRRQRLQPPPTKSINIIMIIIFFFFFFLLFSLPHFSFLLKATLIRFILCGECKFVFVRLAPTFRLFGTLETHTHIHNNPKQNFSLHQRVNEERVKLGFHMLTQKCWPFYITRQNMNSSMFYCKYVSACMCICVYLDRNETKRNVKI